MLAGCGWSGPGTSFGSVDNSPADREDNSPAVRNANNACTARKVFVLKFQILTRRTGLFRWHGTAVITGKPTVTSMFKFPPPDIIGNIGPARSGLAYVRASVCTHFSVNNSLANDSWRALSLRCRQLQLAATSEQF